MPGLIRVDDICRDLVAGVHSLGDDEGLQALELDVARELLRATPRFWSGAAVYMDFLAFTDLVDTRIVSRDPVPAHATPTNRLEEALTRLYTTIENGAQRPLAMAIIGVEWTSPKTWIYEARYVFEDWIE